MKTSSILAAAGLVAIAQAQSQCNSVALAVPACATSCIQSAASKVGCGVLDFVCQCGAASSAAINSAAFGCVLNTCGPTTGLAVQTSAAAVCACAASVGGGGTPSSTPVPSTSVASSMATSSMASSMAGSSMAASSMISSGAASAGSSASIPSSTAGASKASSAAPAGSSAATSPSSAAPFTGVGLQVIISVGAGLAVFLGLVAAL